MVEITPTAQTFHETGPNSSTSEMYVRSCNKSYFLHFDSRIYLPSSFIIIRKTISVDFWTIAPPDMNHHKGDIPNRRRGNVKQSIRNKLEKQSTIGRWNMETKSSKSAISCWQTNTNSLKVVRRLSVGCCKDGHRNGNARWTSPIHQIAFSSPWIDRRWLTYSDQRRGLFESSPLDSTPWLPETVCSFDQRYGGCCQREKLARISPTFH
jgi:hypothetical protein